MSTTSIFLLFFSSILASIALVSFIRKRHHIKQHLLMPVAIKPTYSSMNPLLMNRYIGVALSNTFDRTFARIHNVETRVRLVEIISTCCRWPTTGLTMSLLDLSNRLSNASKDESDTELRFWLNELSTVSIEQLSTMVEDVDSTYIQSDDLTQLVSFCLKNVNLASLEYA